MPPQHLLTTLLGDYWYRREEHLPSAALVRLAEEFGVSAVAARAALSRLARRGLLESAKRGRRTYYRLTDRADEVLTEGQAHIMSFGGDSEPWDHLWTIAGFSVPEEQRDQRHALRTRLRWLGFAPLYDGMWVSPRAGAAETLKVLRELGVGSATVFRAEHIQPAATPSTPTAPPSGQAGSGAAPSEAAGFGAASGRAGSERTGNGLDGDGSGLRDPVQAWDFDELRAAYDGFLAHYEPMLERVREGTVGAAEALITRSGIMDTWRTFPSLEPGLPEELLPAGWPRSRARALFVEVYDKLGPLAEIRVAQIVAEFDPTLAKRVHHHTTRTITHT